MKRLIFILPIVFILSPIASLGGTVVYQDSGIKYLSLIIPAKWYSEIDAEKDSVHTIMRLYSPQREVNIRITISEISHIDKLVKSYSALYNLIRADHKNDFLLGEPYKLRINKIDFTFVDAVDKDSANPKACFSTTGFFHCRNKILKIFYYGSVESVNKYEKEFRRIVESIKILK